MVDGDAPNAAWRFNNGLLKDEIKVSGKGIGEGERKERCDLLASCDFFFSRSLFSRCSFTFLCHQHCSILVFRALV